ncbi:MAG: HEAT repeat domain-containing protein [Candidatus Kerfeldbacteria bacterium]|nr:HEAT repeat domain-containing protein [Candidatus Kerfeldbacteria bacterium]
MIVAAVVIGTLFAPLAASAVVNNADSLTDRGRFLVLLLKSNNDSYTRGAAAHQLIEIGAPAVPLLVSSLSQGDSATKHLTASVLRYIGEPAVPGLIASLRSVSTRPFAGSALIDMGTPAIPYLLGAMQDPVTDMNLERSIAYIFQRMGSRAVPYLVNAMRSKKALAAFTALANIGEPAIPYLMDELKGPDERMVPARVQLGYMGSTNTRLAQVMIPRLMELLEHSEGAITRNGLTASTLLGRIGTPAIPAVEKLLDSKDADSRFKAVTTLGLMHSAARPVLPKLRTMVLSENDPGLREHIRIAIRHIESVGR